MRVLRGDIYYADLGPARGSIQGGIRPVVVLQNDVGNYFSPTVIVASLTSNCSKNELPVHVFIEAHNSSFERDSIVLLEQICTLNKRPDLKEFIGRLSEEDMRRVDRAVCISLFVGDGKTSVNL